MYDLLIKNVTVLDPQDDVCNVLTDYDIAVKGGRIASLQATGLIKPSETIEVLDGAGMVAMPGLINTHAHTPMVLLRGVAEDVSVEEWFNEYVWTMEANLTPEDIYWGALLAAVEMIESGVTTVADHYF